jgi:hypothetical protein
MTHGSLTWSGRRCTKLTLRQEFLALSKELEMKNDEKERTLRQKGRTSLQRKVLRMTR